MPIHSALFLDFDNVFITLQKDSAELARRFALKPQIWLKAVEQQLGLPEGDEGPVRRLLIRRCYAAPKTIDHSRINFTRAGLEVVDCPPLTSHSKNGADISIVMDVMDSIARFPHIEEYVILSADADFVPVLHRLRKELKQSIIFASFDTASAYRNCADRTIDANFFRKHLEVDTPPARRPAPLPSDRNQSEPQNNLTPEFWSKVEASLRRAATERLGNVPFATAAQKLRADLPDVLGKNWGGYQRFHELMAAAPIFAGLVTDLKLDEIRIDDFKLDLTSWCEAGKGDMENFVNDVLTFQEKHIPFLSPDRYSSVFGALAKAFTEGSVTLTDAVAAALAHCKAAGHDVSAQDIRFIAVGVSSQGCTLDSTSTASDFASAWRVNVWELCGEPEWMCDPDEALMLATWFHAPDESDQDGATDFIQIQSTGSDGSSETHVAE